MVSRIICILLFFPLLSCAQNLEFTESVLISEPGEYSVPEGEVWKLKSVTGMPVSMQKQYCSFTGSSGSYSSGYNYRYNISCNMFSINSINYGLIEQEMTHKTSVFNETSCDYIPEIFGMNSYSFEYIYNTEIYLSTTDVLKLYIGGLQANILKFRKD